MNKEELRERINSLPLFEKRKVFVKDKPENGAEEEYKLNEQDNYRAICEVNHSKAVAFVNSSRYNLFQFSEIFTPILDSVDDNVDGYVIHWGGYASMTIFPSDQELKDNNGKFGITCVNSVDCSSAVVVKFCVRKNHRTITIPPKVAGLKKQHSKGTKIAVQDYVSMIGPVKEAWGNIVTRFPKFEVKNSITESNQLEFDSVCEHIGFGKRLKKLLREQFDDHTAQGNKYSLWDLFVDAVEVVTNRNYKSDVHRTKKIEKLSEAVFKFNTLIELSDE
jgi:hypothetical protein